MPSTVNNFKYKLQFYRATKEFTGLLKLFKFGKMIGKWKARSGQPEFRSYWTPSRSPIPASDSIVGSYAVESGYVPGYPGAMGTWYFHIVPDPIHHKNGTGVRSEIGIHEDANFATAPGTAGCIGVDPGDWQECRMVLDAIFQQECRIEPTYKIPLEVIYGAVSAIQPEKPVAVAALSPFEKALKFTLEWEGGFADNPADYGGRTMKGITQATYDSFRKGLRLPLKDVYYIEDHEVRDIYEVRYWQASRCDEMMEALAIVMFDTAVNFGIGGAGIFLQEALGFSGADVDGIVGKNTWAALQAGKNTKDIAMRMIEGRIAYRNQRVKQDPSQRVFLKGWLNRDYALKRLIRDNF